MLKSMLAKPGKAVSLVLQLIYPNIKIYDDVARGGLVDYITKPPVFFGIIFRLNLALT
jgi:hypothetical protein